MTKTAWAAKSKIFPILPSIEKTVDPLYKILIMSNVFDTHKIGGIKAMETVSCILGLDQRAKILVDFKLSKIFALKFSMSKPLVQIQAR